MPKIHKRVGNNTKINNIMAKSDFICQHCKQTVTFGFLSIVQPRRYQCPNHGLLCKDCVDKPLIGKARCKECGSKVLEYKFENNRWTQV